MSTIATKFSAAKLQLGTAAVATVLAAATLTPAVAEAAPSVSFAPISQALGSTVEDWIVPVNSATPGDVSSAVGDDFAAFAVDPITGIVKFFANIVYQTLSFIGNTIVAVANGVARFFQVGPYAV
ncbi:hypothetical protein [Mycolicibacterium komossense]|uniref:PE-PGRS family protein n=1 Tax=Mycolicibacterium komossense TaxID=1779 RepID=A0ABT3CDF5_9MYCO|nr:hypothetical protein [Mycolicibacterium komossense]MCV7227520.1 hypothetical protein [Mycolicibacterium komossense]